MRTATRACSAVFLLSLSLALLAGCDDEVPSTCAEDDRNLCGGCEALFGEPGTPCGDCGTFVCDGEDSLDCVDPGANACGGCSVLLGALGEACGECGSSACDGLNAIHCDDPGLNACGGCEVLPGAPGDHCGECGSLACDGENSLACEDDVTNECGGCGSLSGSAGDRCGECGNLVCEGTEALACDDPGQDPCGGCGSDDYVGGDWSLTLGVPEELVLCSTFSASRSLEDELRSKAMLRVTPGSWPLPDEDGRHPYVLPHCFELVDRDEKMRPLGVGEMSTNHESDYLRFNYSQDLSSGEMMTQQVQASFHGPRVDSGEAFRLDNEHRGFGASSSYFRLCDGVCENNTDVRWFDSCLFDGGDVRRYLHTVGLAEGLGEVVLDVRLGYSISGTASGLFRGAGGVLDGQSFTQDSFWKLVYRPGHHHWVRDFAVLFDAPIMEACGLRIEGVSPWNESPLPVAYLVDCDLQILGTLVVESSTTETIYP